MIVHIGVNWSANLTLKKVMQWRYRLSGLLKTPSLRFHLNSNLNLAENITEKTPPVKTLVQKPKSFFFFSKLSRQISEVVWKNERN